MNPTLGKLAQWLLLNSKAGAIIGLVLLAVSLVGFGGWGVTAVQLKQSQDRIVEVSKDAGKAEGQLQQLAADSDRRTKEGNAAIDAAEKSAQRSYATAKGLMAAKPSNPNDLCQSADELIRQAIEQEHR